MSSRHLHNIDLRGYCKFLDYIGCKCIRTKGGHHQYVRNDLGRPLTLQTHIDPVPEFIIKGHLRVLKMTKEEFLDIFYTKC